MPEVIRMEGVLVKEKAVIETQENGKTVKKNGIKFMLDVEGYKIPCPDKTVDKLITAIGVKKAFTEKLLYECGPYDLQFASEGISTEVTAIADYGREKFAVCKLGENTAYVYSKDGETAGLKLMPAVDKLAIYHKEKHIRII